MAVSDDKVMDTVRSVGARCVAAALPETCADAAGPGDVLVLMADGWTARHRGPRWGEEGAPREERVYFFSDGGVYLWNIWEIREKGGPKTEMRPK